MGADKETPKRAYAVLEAYARYYTETRAVTAPKNKEMAKRMGFGASTISEYLSHMRRAGLMADDNSVTKQGYAWLDEHAVVLPTSIPIAGKVQGGLAHFDELTHYINSVEDLVSPNAPRLIVPKMRDDRRTIALEVRGDSMVEEKIYQGDHVIVELFKQGESPKRGELIIARFVRKSKVAHLIKSSIDLPDTSEATELEGPTVKYYFPDIDCIRLSPCKSPTAASADVIVAASVDPWGRVIGVYRQVA